MIESEGLSLALLNKESEAVIQLVSTRCLIVRLTGHFLDYKNLVIFWTTYDSFSGVYRKCKSIHVY